MQQHSDQASSQRQVCGRTRLDLALVRQGLAHSRVQAQRLIDQEQVLVNSRIIAKSSTKVCQSDHITLLNSQQYVSRAAYKLLGAIAGFASVGLLFDHCSCALDIGASTGGFTQVLLEQGVQRVIALDVGHDQLHASLRDDPRVIDMSGCNVRDITLDDLPMQPDAIVTDVSFISLQFVIPVIARLARREAPIVMLVKPQFEVGRSNLNKHGIVKDDGLIDEVIKRITDCAQNNGLEVQGVAPSVITGLHGNTEYVMFARQST